MNIEETKKAIEVMQAFVDGRKKEVEWRWISSTPGPWETVSSPSWNWTHIEYRIKPQPKEVWVNEYAGDEDVGHEAFNSERAANMCACSSTIRKAVRYREVIG